MSNGDIKIQRIQAKHREGMELLGSVLKPEVLHTAVPRLATVAQARVEHANKMKTISTLAPDRPGSQGYDPTRKFLYVAQIDQSVWAAILAVFGKTDEKGQPLEDGLLYKEDERGNIRLHRDFFFALIDYLQAQGYNCDMRMKKRLVV
jgi:hypothetical protein